ncbi:hypothetical protein EDC01DRAFT_148446 [Geopyxis carbonaria]|nr:hypothetical protein EDC01DRAFT_148446 [Geopyxis carbonaria]
MDHAPPPPPPPPPPLPPSSRREGKISKPSTNTAMPRPPIPTSLLPEQDNRANTASYYQFLQATKVHSEPFHPCYMFFYGSLMDPEVLQAILDLPKLPTTKPATISGFRIKMWSIYPTLLSSYSGSVTGTVWKVTSEAHFDRLVAYETSHYRWTKCEAVLEGGEVLSNCLTFCWAEKLNSKELEDGSFDLEHYQKYYKSSVTRRRPPVP